MLKSILHGTCLAVSAVLLLLAGNVHASGENYRLTEKALGQYEHATEAMYRFARDNPQYADALEDESEGAGDVTQIVKSIDDRAPGLRAAMEKSGMKMEEYFTFSMSLVASALGAAMIDQFGGDESRLDELQRQNMDFVRKYQPRMETFNSRMQQEYADVLQSEDEGEDEYYGDEEYYEDE